MLQKHVFYCPNAICVFLPLLSFSYILYATSAFVFSYWICNPIFFLCHIAECGQAHLEKTCGVVCNFANSKHYRCYNFKDEMYLTGDLFCCRSQPLVAMRFLATVRENARHATAIKQGTVPVHLRNRLSGFREDEPQSCIFSRVRLLLAQPADQQG